MTSRRTAAESPWPAHEGDGGRRARHIERVAAVDADDDRPPGVELAGAGWQRYRSVASTVCWPSNARPGPGAGPTPRSASRATRALGLPCASHCSTCLPRAAADGEAAVGARGLSGPTYSGHVFWDSDVFVLPFLAAIRPAAARAMLEYRIRRLAAARRSARGARAARRPVPLGVGRATARM